MALMVKPNNMFGEGVRNAYQFAFRVDMRPDDEN